MIRPGDTVAYVMSDGSITSGTGTVDKVRDGHALVRWHGGTLTWDLASRLVVIEDLPPL